MYFVDNNTGVPVMPPVKEVLSNTPLFFTEGGNGVPPTWPGPDWFNIIQSELINFLAAYGVNPEKSNLNQLQAAVEEAIRQKATESSALLTAIAALVTSANQMPYFTGEDEVGMTALTAFAREILAQTNAAGVLTKLGLGNLVNALIKTNNLSDLPDKALSRTNLGVPKGVDKQMCNEWCVFNGVTTITMGDSLGISSVTRTGVGQYTVNLSTPYQTTNYAVMGRWTSSTIERDHELSVMPGRTTSSFQLYCASDSSNVYPSTDAVELSLAVWGAK